MAGKHCDGEDEGQGLGSCGPLEVLRLLSGTSVCASIARQKYFTSLVTPQCSIIDFERLFSVVTKPIEEDHDTDGTEHMEACLSADRKHCSFRSSHVEQESLIVVKIFW